MGSLRLPPGGVVYVDSNCVIYAVERIQPYCDALQPVWHSAASGEIRAATSEISLLEVLVKPLRLGDARLEADFRRFCGSREFQFLPVSTHVIDRAARVRAESGLKTPDAIHAATAVGLGAQLLITNDPGFRRVEGLPVAVLSEVLSET